MNLKLEVVPINILLAEDDIDDRFFFERALNAIPILTRLTTVPDGEQLMNYLNHNSTNLPDILFLDLSMPRKTGFECLCEIKENDTLKDIKVIIFSTSFAKDNSYEQNMIDTLHGIGAHEYIRKPDNAEQLKSVIHNALIAAQEKKVA